MATSKFCKAELLKKLSNHLNSELHADAVYYNRTRANGLMIGWYYQNLYLGTNLAVALEYGIHSVPVETIPPAGVQLATPTQQPQAQAAPTWPALAKIATPEFQTPTPPKTTGNVVNLSDYRKKIATPAFELKGPDELRHLPPQKIGAEVGGEVVAKQNRDWLSPENLSDLVGITERAAQMALSNAFNTNKPWRGVYLHVRIVKNDKGGGKGGDSYEVSALSLPEDLQGKWYAQFIPTSPLNIPITHVPADTTAFRPSLQKAVDDAMKRYDIIKAILPLPRRSALRKAKILEVAQREDVSVTTLYLWLKAYEKGDGVAGITRKPRNDYGKERTRLTRTWDQATTHIIEHARSSIITAIENYIRGMWASGYGWSDIVAATSLKLRQLTAAVDPTIPPATLEQICQFTRARVEKEKQYALVHLQKTDAKGFYDLASPTVRRSRLGLLPNDIWVGDVHHIDILLTRPDGTTATPKMITWYDPATNHAYVTVALMEAGRMIRRQDVALAFASAVAYRGLPKKLFIDNGTEFDWRCMLEGFATLNRLVPNFAYTLGTPESELENFSSAYEAKDLAYPIESFMEKDPEIILHTKPYQPRARPIEGWFGLFEQKYLSKIPGWIGGNRMKKPTQNLGKAPKPYPGTWEEFFKDLEIKLGEYHSRPQKGYLQGHSPNQALQQFIDHGWHATSTTESAVLLAFAEVPDRARDRKVYPGGRIVWNNLNYRHDALLPFVTITGINQPLEIRVPTHDPRFLFAILPSKEVITVPLDQEYPFFDLARRGAEEQKRLKRLLDHYVAAQAHNCSRIDHRQLSLELTAAAGPAPAIPFGTSVELTNELCQLEEITLKEATNNLPVWTPTAQPAPINRFNYGED